MRKIFFLKAGNKSLHLAKLMGAFIIFAAALLFVQAGAQMFESWENAKSLNECFIAANSSLSLEDKMFCQNQASMAGIFVRLDQKELSAKQFWIVLLSPIAWLLLWVVLFIIGLMVYSLGKVIGPVIEEENRAVGGRRFVFKPRKPRH